MTSILLEVNSYASVQGQSLCTSEDEHIGTFLLYATQCYAMDFRTAGVLHGFCKSVDYDRILNSHGNGTSISCTS